MPLELENKKLKQVREMLGCTQSQFGELLGLHFSTTDMERGRTRITGEVVMRLLKDYDINPLWMYGHSEKMYLKLHEPHIMPKAITVDDQGNENILLVNSKASAGYGLNIQDAEYIQSMPAFRLPLPQYRNASFRGFQIKGDSMTPLVNDGDWVLAKALDSYEEIKNGGIYIIVEKDSIRLKKIEQSTDRKILHLISLNREYMPTSIPAREVVEIWSYHSRISFGIDKIQGLELNHVLEEVKALKKMVRMGIGTNNALES